MANQTSELIGSGPVHFIGIGGAGMSAVAKALLEMGVEVSGSDLKESRYTRALVEIGAKVAIGHAPSNLPEGGVVVISSAIPEYNPELRAAREGSLKVVARAEMLAAICRQKPRTIAIGGTHGKTSTTSMAALMLERAGLKPTFLVGGELNDIGSNAQYGEGDVCVVEADESDGSLVHLSPTDAVITNIDHDHLDFHKSFENILTLFTDWIRALPQGARAIVLGDGSTAEAVAKASGRDYLTFGRGDENDLYFMSEAFTDFGSQFTVCERDTGVTVDARLRVPGEHNIYNAMAALTAVRSVGLEIKEAVRVLGEFRGVKRRFQVLGMSQDVAVVDDYAHHPTEVAATIAAAKGTGRRRVISVFQPHRFSRTKLLAAEFGTAFAGADHIILTNIYNAGEEPIPGVSGKLLVDEILKRRPRSKVTYIPDKSEITEYLDATVRAGDIVIMMGAGDIGSIGYEFAARLAETG